MATVLVLGASRGIGLEFVRQYRALWDRVIATARDEAGMRRIEALGATALKLDVTEPADVAGLARQLEGEKIDIALYVPGIYGASDATAPPSATEFDQVMRTNVLGAMHAIPQIAPLVEAAGGKFVFLSSDLGHIAGAKSSFRWTYRASKAALNMTVASAQNDYPGAVFIAINPGSVKTDLGRPGAALEVEHSVSAMRQTLGGLTSRYKGAFLNYDGRRFKTW